MKRLCTTIQQRRVWYQIIIYRCCIISRTATRCLRSRRSGLICSIKAWSWSSKRSLRTQRKVDPGRVQVLSIMPTSSHQPFLIHLMKFKIRLPAKKSMSKNTKREIQTDSLQSLCLVPLIPTSLLFQELLEMCFPKNGVIYSNSSPSAKGPPKFRKVSSQWITAHLIYHQKQKKNKGEPTSWWKKTDGNIPKSSKKSNNNKRNKSSNKSRKKKGLQKYGRRKFSRTGTILNQQQE